MKILRFSWKFQLLCLYDIKIWIWSKGQNLERPINLWPWPQFQGHKPRIPNQKTLGLYYVWFMSNITFRIILNIRGAKTPVYCLRTLATKIYKLQHVATNNLVKIICRYLIRFMKMSENKPKSKFRIWPWPLTLT